jgi:hypothetical protein
VPFIDSLKSTISSRNSRSDPRLLIDEAEFAEDAIGGNRFKMEMINENVDFSFLYDVHLLPFVSLLENAGPSRKRNSFRSICEDIAESHDLEGVGFPSSFASLSRNRSPGGFFASPRGDFPANLVAQRRLLKAFAKVPRSAPRIREPPSCGNQRMAAGHCLSESGKATLEFNRPQFLVPASHLQPRTLIVTIFSQRNHGFLGRHYSSVSFTFSETPSKVFREGA